MTVKMNIASDVRCARLIPCSRPIDCWLAGSQQIMLHRSESLEMFCQRTNATCMCGVKHRIRAPGLGPFIPYTAASSSSEMLRENITSNFTQINRVAADERQDKQPAKESPSYHSMHGRSVENIPIETIDMLFAIVKVLQQHTVSP